MANKFEYEFWTVAELQTQGLSAQFAESFNYFVRDVLGDGGSSGTGLEARVSQNEDDIDSLNNAVQSINSDLNNHVNSNEQHGATGDIVGQGDFCQASVGGVVLLASSISDLAQISIPDLGVAPATYSQAYTQSMAELTNANKAKVNEIVAKINAIIAGQKSAKQMSGA